MERGRFISLAALAGALVVSAGVSTPAQAAGITTTAAPILTPADGRVLVTFGGVLNSKGYNVYCHTAGAAPVLVGSTTYTWLVDDGAGKGLANGTPLYYSVKAVGADDKEGPASLENVTTPAPPLFGALVAYNITTPGVNPSPGTVTLDTAKDLITINAAGDDIWDKQDGQTFVATPVTGDFSIQAKFPGPPTGGDPTYGKVGLEMRTGVAPLDPYALVFISVHRDPAIMFEFRKLLDGTGNGGGGNGDTADDQKYPVWLKLSRQDTMMSAQQSQDGTNWTDVYDAQDFTRLPPTVYVGLAATAHNNNDPALTNLTAQVVASSVSINTP